MNILNKIKEIDIFGYKKALNNSLLHQNTIYTIDNKQEQKNDNNNENYYTQILKIHSKHSKKIYTTLSVFLVEGITVYIIWVL